MDQFYSEDDTAQWRAVLGPNMHYHHGVWDGGSGGIRSAQISIDKNEADEEALSRAITMLYPYIPEGATVLDIGCGWCGPAAQLARDRGCVVTAVTASAAQAEFCGTVTRGTRDSVRVFHADADVPWDVDVATSGGNTSSAPQGPGSTAPRRPPPVWASPGITTLVDGGSDKPLASASAAPPRLYDVALLMESISHITNRASLLTQLAGAAEKLIVRANTFDGARGKAGAVFGGPCPFLPQQSCSSSCVRRVGIQSESKTFAAEHAEHLRCKSRPFLPASLFVPGRILSEWVRGVRPIPLSLHYSGNTCV
jgi:hypothetical protein